MKNDKVPAIEVIGISKQYPGVRALQNITWEVQSGEVHGLAGKNGAGKSTLIKILGGSVQPDSGEIRLNGHKVSFSKPHDSIGKGIAIINQELMLIPLLSVAENILLGRLPHGRLGGVDWAQANEKARESLQRVGMEIDPSSLVNSLSMPQQQAVEIARALSRQADILVMDEPTSALAAREVDNLLDTVRRLREQGKTIIYITHKLDEIFAVADRITVLRDGMNIATVNPGDVTPAQVVNFMVGRRMESLFLKNKSAPIGEPVLEVKHLTRHGIFEDISLTLHSGEILGLAGLVGSGRTEVLRAIFGIDPIDSGEIWVCGKRADRITPEKMISARVGMAPEDRKQQGLVLGMSILDNFTLASLIHLFRNRKEELEIGEKLFTNLSIRAPSLSTLVFKLSGGNQQKVVIGKWLATSPRVLFLDEPTRGIDISTKADIHLLVQNLAQQGVGIIMVSSELPDLISVCDRMVVLSSGHISGEFRYGEADEETLVAYATGSRVASQTNGTKVNVIKNE
jgi:ABC-type sugar transport system ATPase subunit